jgi:hypothetical protein
VDEEPEVEQVEEATEDVFVIDAVPWHNGDTAAAMFQFAANQSLAAAALFQNMALLAIGQSTHEWHQDDREEFVEDAVSTIQKLIEGDGSDG